MSKEFDIEERWLERCAESLLKTKCEDFIFGLFAESDVPKDVLKTMAEELYKGSTMHSEDKKLVITFKFPDYDNGVKETK